MGKGEGKAKKNFLRIKGRMEGSLYRKEEILYIRNMKDRKKKEKRGK